jgi:hydroxyacylglutathione hydrolase
MLMEIITLPVSSDNYAYCITYGLEAVVIDACDPAVVANFIDSREFQLRMILSTHHHPDHTAGNISLKKKTGCMIAGGDQRIPGIDHIVKNGETVSAGPFSFECMAVPGHTSGSFAFFSQELSAIFTGDTLFYSGCGRIFEGIASQMAHSLWKIASLPLPTAIYCGHEYTLENLRFAAAVEPENEAIKERRAAIQELLANNQPSGPSTLENELATNPFLRTDQRAIRNAVGLSDAPSDEVFAELRRRKDGY